MTAIDWGWSIEETARRLLQESTKAQENGEKYALTTARNAAAAVERRGQPVKIDAVLLKAQVFSIAGQGDTPYPCADFITFRYYGRSRQGPEFLPIFVHGLPNWNRGPLRGALL
jgi:hypothetical protein